MFRTSRALSIALVALAVVAAACGSSGKATGAKASNDTAVRESSTTGETMMSHSTGAMSSSYIKAADQQSDGTKVVVEEVVLTGSSGWVAVQADNGGAMGDLLGVSRLLAAGTSMGATVTLTKPLTASGTVFLVLHLEDNHNSSFDFPNGDAPAKVDNKVVDVPVHVAVK